VRRGRAALLLSAALATSAATAGALLAACTLDFDRYTVASGITASPDASSDTGTSGDAIREDAADGGGSDADAGAADGALDGASTSCTPAPACLVQATSCGSSCGVANQQCTTGCADAQACLVDCRSALQSCLGACATTCFACEREAGCPATNACLDAAHS
jgi:hypothetical protein